MPLRAARGGVIRRRLQHAVSNIIPPTVPGLILWLDATDVNGNGTSTPNGTAIATWTDKSGLGNNAVQATGANQPILTTGVQNGLPVLRCNQPAGYMTAPVNISPSVNPNITVFFVYQERTNASVGLLFGNNAGGGMRPRAQLLEFSNPPLDYGVSTSVAPLPVPGLSPFNIFKVYELNSQNSVTNGSFVYINGAQALNYTALCGDGSASMGIAAWGGTGLFPSNTDIAEVIVYSNAITSDQNTTITTYLLAKWGITP